MLRLSCIVFCWITLLGFVHAEEEEEEFQPEYYTRNEWIEWREKLRGFDEIRMTLAIKTVSVPVKWDGSEMKYEERWIRDTLLHKQEAIADSESFIALLEFQPDVEKTSHGCYGLFNLFFYRKGERVGRLHYAHSEYWFPITKESQNKLNRWLMERGFPIEEVLKNDKKEG